MVIKSPYADVTVPTVDLWSLLFDRKTKPYPDDKEIFTDGDTGRSYDWTQLKKSSVEFGKGMKSQWGLGKGDVLAIFSPNNVDYPPVIWGALWAGITVTAANPTYTLKELTFQLKDSRSKGIVTQLPMLPIVLEATKIVGIPESRIVLMGDVKDSTGKFKHFTEIRNQNMLVPCRKARIDNSKDLAFLVYSSGTTGLPKGVMLTHRNIAANVIQMTTVEAKSGLHWSGGPDGKGDKQLSALPFFHIYGLNLLHGTVWEGFQAIVMAKYDLERACQLIQDHEITFAHVPPPIILGLAKHPVVAKYDLSSIKFLSSGAAPLSKDLIDALWERLTVPVKQGYGLSETSPGTNMQVVLEWAKYKQSVGKLFPNMEAKIVDLEGHEVPAGQEGELWMKGPNVFPGYYNRPELAKDTFSECGFFKTGDIGYIDAKGNFYITDRLKELIKYKGFQVAPAELEGVLLGHSEIADACVIGAFDKERATEVPRAYLVVRPGTPKTPDKAKELVDWLQSKVAPHKQLRGGVRFIDEVPKNASGKILRRILKEQTKLEDRAEGAKL